MRPFQELQRAATEAVRELYPAGGEYATEVTVRVSDGHEIKVPVPRAVALQPAPRPAAVRHSPDFRSVHWRGTDYVFTPAQAGVVKLLWEAADNGTPEVGGDTLLESVESECDSLRVLFRDHPAWPALITSPRKGVYRLPP